jgi:hypothetical protein
MTFWQMVRRGNVPSHRGVQFTTDLLVKQVVVRPVAVFNASLVQTGNAIEAVRRMSDAEAGASERASR